MKVSSENSNPDSSLQLCRAELDAYLNDARGGSEAALGRLLAAAHRYLLAIADQALPDTVRAKVSPSDLVQDTALEGFKDFNQFDGEKYEELLAWLRKILLNNLANAGRRFERTRMRQVSREMPLLGQLGNETALADRKPSPSKEMISLERELALERALMKLPVDMREAIVLRNQEHLSFADIGERLNRSSEAARKLWARAIERLQEAMM